MKQLNSSLLHTMLPAWSLQCTSIFFANYEDFSFAAGIIDSKLNLSPALNPSKHKRKIELTKKLLMINFV